eukprot:scaffold87195_cov19-Tisochrysis_lutea.AAC.1
MFGAVSSFMSKGGMHWLWVHVKSAWANLDGPPALPQECVTVASGAASPCLHLCSCGEPGPPAYRQEWVAAAGGAALADALLLMSA